MQSTPSSAIATTIANIRQVGETRLAPDGSHVAFLSGHHGRADLVVAPITRGVLGRARPVTTDPTVSASISHGGGTFAWAPDSATLLFRAATGDLWSVRRDGTQLRLVLQPQDQSQDQSTASAAASAWARAGAACMLSTDATQDVVWIDPSGVRPPEQISGDADFCFDPDVSCDGSVAWHEWDAPAMPWDVSRIMLCRRGKPPSAVDGGDSVSVAQPRFSPSGRLLAYISDRSGWWNLWVIDLASGTKRQLVDIDAEVGGPSWGPGMRSYAWSPDGSRIAYTLNRDGRVSLWTACVATGVPQPLVIRDGVCGSVSWAADRIAITYTDPHTPTQVELIDPTTRAATVASRHDDSCGTAEHVTWSGDGGDVHGVCIRPQGVDAPGPLLVWVHGGPTGQAQFSFSARQSFFVARGWTVLHVNHRGSTGYGRAYTQALRGRWGLLDASDVCSGTKEMIRRGVADPNRVAIMGASAGGYTVLQALIAAPDMFAGGVDLYGIADLLRLTATTHRFEAHYNDTLIGPLPDCAELYRERSPMTHANRIRAPLLVLHGRNDKVVPPEQAQMIVDALRSNNVPVEYHVYPDEGHGWSTPETVADELGRIEAFLRRYVLDPPAANKLH